MPLPHVILHGVGSRGDLPLPLWQFVWASAAALVISFLALGLLWTEPRLRRAAEGRPLARTTRVLRALEWPARLASLLLFVLVLVAALFGTSSIDENLAPVAIYVVFWVGLQVFSAVFGDVWRTISPYDTVGILIERVIRRPPVPDLARRIGRWPAAAGGFGFLFLELVHPSGSEPGVLGVAIVVYSVAMLAGVAIAGRGWLRHGEFFASLFGLLGAMAPLRGGSDRVQLRVPLSGLANVAPWPGTAALVLIVLGGTTFDGLKESQTWRDLVGRPSGWTDGGYSLLGLMAATAVVAGLYSLAVAYTAKVTGGRFDETAEAFAPSLVPIVLGYAIAHYAQLLVDETQSFIFLLSDPLGRGWDLFGGADGEIDFTLISPDAIAWIQVLGIVAGHVAGVIVAHDRAVERYSALQALRSQSAMLFVMVVYSIAGLWLLFTA